MSQRKVHKYVERFKDEGVLQFTFCMTSDSKTGSLKQMTWCDSVMSFSLLCAPALMLMVCLRARDGDML